MWNLILNISNDIAEVLIGQTCGLVVSDPGLNLGMFFHYPIAQNTLHFF